MNSEFTKEEDLFKQMCILKALVHGAKPGDKVVDYKSGEIGVVISKKSFESFRIDWENKHSGLKELTYYHYSASPPWDFKIVLLDKYQEILSLEKRIDAIRDVENRIQWSQFLNYLKKVDEKDNGVEMLKEKFHLSEAEVGYLLNHPRVKFFYS